jgi:hypothetical protein
VTRAVGLNPTAQRLLAHRAWYHVRVLVDLGLPLPYLVLPYDKGYGVLDLGRVGY